MCGRPLESLPIDTGYHSDMFDTGYVLQRTCDKCTGTYVQELQGTPETVLVQLLSANALMTADNSVEGWRRRVLLNEAILQLFHDAIKAERNRATTARAPNAPAP